MSNGWSESEVDELIKDKYFDSFDFIDDDSFYVYRNITVLNTEIDKFEKTYFNNDIGIYWSLSNDTRALWGDRGDGDDINRTEYQCIGILKIKDINWQELRYAYDDFYPHFLDEREMRAIYPQKNIKIIKCYQD